MPPNGSRLSCGRLARRRKIARRWPVHVGAQYSDSLRAITARQLQALVRPRAYHAVQLLQVTSATVRLSLAVSRTATNGGWRESWIVCLTARQSSPGAMLNPSEEERVSVELSARSSAAPTVITAPSDRRIPDSQCLVRKLRESGGRGRRHNSLTEPTTRRGSVARSRRGVLGRSVVWLASTTVCEREQPAIANQEARRMGGRCLTVVRSRPNGSRLSCGRDVRGRKAVEPQTRRLASEATPFLPTCERPAASSAC